MTLRAPHAPLSMSVGQPPRPRAGLDLQRHSDWGKYCFNDCPQVHDNDRMCTGSFRSSVTMTCFAKTVCYNLPTWAQADALTVDGVGYSLSTPYSGPPQWCSVGSLGG